MHYDTKRSTLTITLGRVVDDAFVEGVDFEYCNRMLDALRQTTSVTKWAGKGTRHAITMAFAEGVTRTFSVSTRNATVREYVLSSVHIAVENRDYVVRYAVLVSEPVQRSHLKKYANSEHALAVALKESALFVFDGQWEYRICKTMTGVSKEKACEATPTFHISLHPTKVMSVGNTRGHTSSSRLVLERGLDLLGRYIVGGAKQVRVSIARIC